MSKRTIVLTGFVVLKFLLHIVLISPEYELHRDEFLHLDQAHHLAWGYLSVPPLTSWISYLILVLGNSVFWIKFFPALFGALTMIVVWKAIKALGGDLFALVLGNTCVLLSVILRLNILYQPNSMDVLCWTTVFFFVLRYIDTENKKWLFAAAITFAFGFLNKYNIVFLALGLLPAILVTSQRKLLSPQRIYLPVLFIFLLILPNLIWQYSNGFPVIYHLRELSDTQLVNVDRFAFMRSQLLFFAGSLFVIIAGLYALLFYKPFSKYRCFFWSIIFTLAIFMYFRSKDYYAIGIYPIYIAFGAVFVSGILSVGKRRYVRAVAIVIPVLLFIPIYQVAFPNHSPQYILKHPQMFKKLGLLRWEDGKDHALPQDFADMVGWKELAGKVDQAFSGLSKDSTLVLCDNYGQTGGINFYSHRGVKAVSFNADYINWFDLRKQYRNLIRVKGLEDKDDELSQTGPYFERSLVADSVTNPFARERGTTIFVFQNARVNINRRISNEISEVKRRWRKF